MEKIKTKLIHKADNQGLIYQSQAASETISLNQRRDVRDDNKNMSSYMPGTVLSTLLVSFYLIFPKSYEVGRLLLCRSGNWGTERLSTS